MVLLHGRLCQAAGSSRQQRITSQQVCHASQPLFMPSRRMRDSPRSRWDILRRLAHRRVRRPSSGAASTAAVKAPDGCGLHPTEAEDICVASAAGRYTATGRPTGSERRTGLHPLPDSTRFTASGWEDGRCDNFSNLGGGSLRPMPHICFTDMGLPWPLVWAVFSDEDENWSSARRVLGDSVHQGHDSLRTNGRKYQIIRSKPWHGTEPTVLGHRVRGTAAGCFALGSAVMLCRRTALLPEDRHRSSENPRVHGFLSARQKVSSILTPHRLSGSGVPGRAEAVQCWWFSLLLEGVAGVLAGLRCLRQTRRTSRLLKSGNRPDPAARRDSPAAAPPATSIIPLAVRWCAHSRCSCMPLDDAGFGSRSRARAKTAL